MATDSKFFGEIVWPIAAQACKMRPDCLSALVMIAGDHHGNIYISTTLDASQYTSEMTQEERTDLFESLMIEATTQYVTDETH